MGEKRGKEREVSQDRGRKRREGIKMEGNMGEKGRE